MTQSKPGTEPTHELIIIGSGLAALNVAARLPESLAKSTVVVDGSGGWLKRWREQGERMGAGHLRTPVTIHPHASPLALQTFAQKKDRLQELAASANNFAPVPSWALFRDFCQARVVGRLPPPLAAVVQEEVTGLELAPESQGVRLQLASGRALSGRVVVYTGAPTQPVLPAWARPLLLPCQATATIPTTGGGSDADFRSTVPAGGSTMRGAGARVPSSGTNAGSGSTANSESSGGLSFPPGSLLTWDQVDLRTAQLDGRHVVVVGGGMTAVTLATGAAAIGARVTLVCRRPLQEAPFACEAGWWGNKRLHEWLQLAEPVARLRACRRARPQGSVHAPLWGQLVQLAAAGRLAVVEGAEVAETSYQLRSSSEGASGRCGWAVRLVPRAAAETAAAAASRRRSGGGEGATVVPPPSAFQEALAAAAAAGGHSAASATSAQGDGAAGAATAAARPELLQADVLWVACGSAYSAERDPLLAALLCQAPAQVVGGYPLIDDATLAWPGAPVLLAGRAAMLAVGPCAGDAGGMRLAADKIVAALKRLQLAGEEPWAAAAARLGGVQVDAVAAALLPPEEEGAIYEEPKAKASVARPAHLIDVSDLDPALPRQELQQYKFTDDGFEICVILQLPEPVPLAQVRTRFGEKSLEMWAVGEAGAYRLYLPQLYGRVIVKKCKAKVNTRTRKVFLLLHKESDAEWRFLKS